MPADPSDRYRLRSLLTEVERAVLLARPEDEVRSCSDLTMFLFMGTVSRVEAG